MRRDATSGAIVAAFVAASVAAGAATEMREHWLYLPLPPTADASESAPPAAPETCVVVQAPSTVS